MGVQTYLLDSRAVPLVIGGTRYAIGTARRFFKLTEIDQQRQAEINAAKMKRAPTAVMIADVSERSMADAPETPVPAHLVLGWDVDRGHVTDANWDYLPKLGFAILRLNSAEREYVLHEERQGMLYPISPLRARELNLFDAEGKLRRQGQRRIISCESVRAYFEGFAEAVCRLEGGDIIKLFVAADVGLPPASWFVGKRPMDVERFPVP